MESIDVLVAGAGPTGLTMACELRRYGLKVRVVDPAPRTTEHSKALVVHARTREVFEAMGLRAAVEAEAQALMAVQLYFEKQLLGTLDVKRFGPDVPTPVFLDQSATERILAEHLGRLGGAVERGLRLLSFRDEGSQVVATIGGEDGRTETVTARWLVGCDGAHSVVRRGLSLPFEGSAYEDMFDQADLKIRWDRPPGVGYGFLRSAGLVVFAPLPRDRYRIIAMGGEGHAPEPTLEMFQKLADELVPGAVLHDPEWILRFRLHHRMVPRMAVGSVFLAGDAAHIHSPAGGQGMNTGIQDAFNLAWKLAMVARGAAKPELLATYDAERLPVAKQTLELTDRLFRGATSRRTMVLRKLIVGTVLRSRALQQRLVRRMSQTGVSYRRSTAVLDARRWPRPSPQAGERAPAATLSAGDTTISLHALVASEAKLTLLLMHGSSRSPALTSAGQELAERWGRSLVVRDLVLGTGDAETLGDRSGAVVRGWRVRAPELVLLRPDGHIAVRAPLARLEVLRAYAARWF
ncbi:2-polyprenyl-6-methoxyphenol hydroxylase [Nannocystis exedens]|uniref:2-polyprenyl-6-methoxyphenol hydroxylase n=1 Tax=Nannocystis exedens TaxID=54 RepID=A0A1I2H6U8_9BACT|nr:FAD-dependent monooxygenase [Nannocystis exedens]PCC75790.1 monooxygenase [Nannocystis exedens]SFF25915.1 2-polyprenyl-6-methoxyphenol hydroxylase [Nannocystis exedens]